MPLRNLLIDYFRKIFILLSWEIYKAIKKSIFFSFPKKVFKNKKVSKNIFQSNTFRVSINFSFKKGVKELILKIRIAKKRLKEVHKKERRKT